MYSLITLTILGLGSAHSALAWGLVGHATVAYVAQDFVKPTTATWAQGILGDTSSSYLASIASWADSYRATTAGKFSAPYHFIDAQDSPPKTCNVNYARDCTAAGCSISAIANYTSRIQDGRLSATNVNQALMFLVHFIGDITQPLHDEALDVGGNTIKVTFDGFASDNLHADWDTYIPQKYIGGTTITYSRKWATTLTTAIKSGAYASQAASWIKGDSINSAVASATRWATDANTFVCSTVMPDGVAALQTGDLYPTYYNSVLPTIQLQIAKAGYRLANWLDLIADAQLGLVSRNDLSEPRTPDQDRSERDLLLDLSMMGPPTAVRAAFGYGCSDHEH